MGSTSEASELAGTIPTSHRIGATPTSATAAITGTHGTGDGCEPARPDTRPHRGGQLRSGGGQRPGGRTDRGAVHGHGPAVVGGRLCTCAQHAARSIVTVTAIGLTALSLALAAPAAAHSPHGSGGISNHSATGATHERAAGAEGSTPPPDDAETPAADPPAAEPPTASGPAVLPGHDKCKRSKGHRGYPPWCTDPAAGWLGSTLHRAEPSYPTAPSHKRSAMPAAHILRRGAVQ
jgi:hypothetical protein